MFKVLKQQTPRQKLYKYGRTTPAAWNDPVKGTELTKAQISQGAMVYAAAGGTGVGFTSSSRRKHSINWSGRKSEL